IIVVINFVCFNVFFRQPAGNKQESYDDSVLLTFNSFKMQCKVCMQTFICTTSEVKCREHAEAKHPKSDVYACFPHLKK
ncbi:hypothetical protein Godav_020596, partial [Gossypium davidsonii]|nr:hypothetical protein [Gossypium davidsonii]